MKKQTLLCTGLLALLAACGQQTASTPQTGSTPAAQAPTKSQLKAQDLTLTVTNTNDNGDGSLRQAILNANTNLGADTITFSLTGPGTINLLSPLPTVADALTINGPGAAKLSISGGGKVRVLEVGATTVAVSGVTITGGYAKNENGGGINVLTGGTLTLTNSVLSTNLASNGGGLYNGGTATVTGSTLSGNGRFSNGASYGEGGGIANAGTLTVTNSTLSGNQGYNGAGIDNRGGAVTVTNSTLNGNVAYSDGSAIRSNNGTTTLQNTIIAGSVSPSCSGSFKDGGGNLHYNIKYGGAPDPSCPGVRADPKLGPLQDNGGATWTHALLAGSAAIDAIPAASCAVTTDQRGVTRPQGAACDIGAFEVNRPPSVTVEQGSTQADPTNTLPLVFTATFSQDVSGFDAGDVSLTGTANLSGARVTVSGGPRVYTLSVSGVTGSGTVSASVAANGATDATGNPNTASTSTDNTVTYDGTAPTITLTSPTEGAISTLGQTVNAAYTCTDAGSGLASCVGTVANGTPIDTASVGSKTFTVTATDRAGNTTNQTATYNVIYPFRGFLQPVDNLPTVNTVKAGSSVPVKFSLSGNRGLNILAQGSPKVSVIPCDGSAPADEIEQTLATSSSGLSYDAGTDTYSYTWKTDKSWAGTCRQLNVLLVDGTSHPATFKFR
ncbi:PxKF domain-containing protein [Deinococcus planocerae]|uniref:PxKF domain-containing protein n=1 Tax=Deinococcus planocerae TaxID=1737569 RepID=UPI000C7F60AE|nr:PxKF domain-containing protein [Deinococcus planocerae]